MYRCTNQETTLDCIRDKLCDSLGGYLRIRKVDGKRYLDMVSLQEYGKICEQPIEFGENLLDYSENVSASDLYTCVIPKGARLDESPVEGLEAYVDITSVNNGKDYLYSEDAVATYGWNRCVVSWDDVTEPENLKRKGEEWLRDNQYETMVLELTAADLSMLDADIESFELGDTVPVYSKPHGMDRTFPVQKLELHLQDPSQDKLQLGNTMKLSYTEQNKGNLSAVNQQLESTRQTTAWLQSAIDNATAMMTGSKGGYKVSEYDEDGRWLRDLYMNAPNKEDATLVMQINMNGIGFSRDGFDGPYKNAWTIDGVLLGEFLKAGSVQAEALSAEYKASVTDEIDTTVTSRFKVAEDLISAEVTRAKNQEVELAAAIQVTSEQITQKVSKGDVSSQLSLESGQITISGPRLKIDTEKFKVDYDGTTEIIDGYFHATGSEGSIAVTQNMIFFTDSESTDAGKISFKRDQLSMCIGGYGPYASCAVGYWGDNTHFNPIIKVTSGGNPAIEFNNGFSVIGKEGITADIRYVRPDMGSSMLHVWHGIIVGDEQLS